MGHDSTLTVAWDYVDDPGNVVAAVQAELQRQAGPYYPLRPAVMGQATGAGCAVWELRNVWLKPGKLREALHAGLYGGQEDPGCWVASAVALYGDQEDNPLDVLARIGPADVDPDGMLRVVAPG